MNLNDPERAKNELLRALEAGGSEAIASAAMFNVWPLLTAHTELLISSVAGLDSDTLDRYPALRLVHPMTVVMARTNGPFLPVLTAEHARSMRPEEVDFLVLTQMIASRTSGDIEGSLRHAKHLHDRIQQIRVEARDRLDGPLWYFHHQIAATFLAAGNSSRALLELATARQLGKLSAQSDAERTALGRVALAHAVRGALVDAEWTLADARSLAPPTPAHEASCESTEKVTAALIAVDRMSDDVDDLLAPLSPYHCTDLTWPFALLARTRALLFRRQPEDVLEAVHLARDSHPVQAGCFASDVITASSIDALLQTGNLARARVIAAKDPAPGPMTRIAMVRLALRQGRHEDASHLLGALARDQTLGPAPRAECVVLAGWTEFAASEDLDRETALQVHRVIRKPENRRLSAMMPRQLVERISERLPEDARTEFDAAVDGIIRFELNERPILTPGEIRVLHALVDGRTTAAMAAALHVSPNTVKSQLRSLYRKLGCATREDAVRVAARHQLFVSRVSPG